MPRSDTHPYLCYFHGRRENLLRASDTVGPQITNCFSGGYVTACDLSTAMSYVLAATARGEIKPRTAGILGYLAQTIVQTIPIAEREYIHTFGVQAWRRAVEHPYHPQDATPLAQPAEASQPQPAQPSSTPTHSPVPSPPTNDAPTAQSANHPTSEPPSGNPAPKPTATTSVPTTDRVQLTPPPKRPPTRTPLPKDPASFAAAILAQKP
jgi:hypothetical protein